MAGCVGGGLRGRPAGVGGGAGSGGREGDVVVRVDDALGGATGVV